MEEKWIQWRPLENLASKYYIDSVVDMIDNFTVNLVDARSEKHKVEIVFLEGVEAYTRVDESFRVKIIHELGEKYGDGFYGDWTFFKVDNSAYVKWLSDQSYTWSDTRTFTHFCLISADVLLDIVTNYEPIVRHVEE